MVAFPHFSGMDSVTDLNPGLWCLSVIWRDPKFKRKERKKKKTGVICTLLHLQQGLFFAIYSGNYLVPYLTCFDLKQHWILNFQSQGLLYFKIPDLSLKEEPTCPDSRKIKESKHILPHWKRGLNSALWCLSVTQTHGLRGVGSHMFLGQDWPQEKALQVTGFRKTQ